MGLNSLQMNAEKLDGQVGSLNPADVLRVEDRDQIHPAAERGLRLRIQLHPIETAVLGIRVNADDRPIEPLVAPPVPCVEEDLHAVADSNFISHLLAASAKQDQPDANDDRDRTVDRPLRVTGHETAGQDVDSLQEPDRAAQDEQPPDDIE